MKGMPHIPTERDYRGAVVICTRNRPRDVAQACAAAFKSGDVATLIIVDSSDGPDTETVVRDLKRSHPKIDVNYVRTAMKSLTRQRNQAAAIGHDLGIDILHYIDDDTEVMPGYFEAIESRFSVDSNVVGVGGVIENSPRIPVKPLTRLFLLSGRYGSVLPSGRATSAQYPAADVGENAPSWLHGCSMSYLTDVVLKYRFDDRLEGYSNGEDIDFGFRISRHHRLSVEPTARCIHRVSQGGHARDEFAYMQAVVIHSWVREHRKEGTSMVAFWWSIFGDLLLHTVHGCLVPRRNGLGYAKGLVRGVVVIVRRQAHRGAVPGS
jgi:GT2 family glycosyltransferase